jgi:RNA polymerase sigma-70 factor (ECF subfamily)
VAVRADDVDLERDRDLVQRYQGGDPDAFDDLYRRYFDRLHGYCQRRVGDRHVAEELAQEAFVRALRAMPSFAGERRFYPWVTVIAQRLCIDHHRRRARVEPAAEIDLGSVEPDHDALFAAVDRSHLAAAMERLAPRHREVLELREHAGLSYQDIAAHLDVPVSTVEALLHRARKALRREFRSVAGASRMWGLPLLGPLAARAGELRARAGDRVPELAAAAAPAAAAIAAAAIAVMPASEPPVRVDAAHRAAPTAATTAIGALAAGAPLAGVVPLDLSGAAVAPQRPVGTGAAALAPSVRVGVTHVYTGQRAQQKRHDVEEMPTYVDAGPVEVGLDLDELGDRLTERVLADDPEETTSP